MQYAITLPKIKALVTNIYHAINLIYPNINSICKFYTELNNHARKIGGQAAYDASVSVFRRTDAQSRDVRAHAQAVVSDKNRRLK